MRRTTILVASALLSLACSKSPASSSSTSPSGASAEPGPLRVTPIAGELAVGAPPPSFSATAHDGTRLDLAALKGKWVVVYFYPKDETPGCTKEACAFRDRIKAGALSREDVVLVGVSTDSLESHRKFAQHHDLPFHLVSDPSGDLAKAFGVPNRLGFLGRQTFVIGKDGNVAKIFRDVDVAAHDAEIVEVVGGAKP